MTTTITGKNQVTLPAKIVKELNLHAGVQLDWSIAEDGAIQARRRLSRVELVRNLSGRGRRFLRPESDPVWDLIQEREREEREEGLE